MSAPSTSQKPLRIAVVGLGYWGPNLVRNFAAAPGIEVGCVCDLDPKRLEGLNRQYRIGRTSTSFEDVLSDSTIDAVAIATPIGTHRKLGEAALDAGKHVWVEKPLATTVEDAEALVRKAKAKGRTLFVDHTFLYTSAVRQIREMVKKGELGELLYIDSVRVNLGLFQSDANVIWDLGPHDLSIAQHILGRSPREVSAFAVRHIEGATENLAYLTLKYDGKLVAHFHVNWLAPAKVRLMMIGGSKRMVVFDDLQATEKLKVYDTGVDVATAANPSDPEARRQTRIAYRTGDLFSPRIDHTEALALAARDFAGAIAEGRAPIADGQLGLDVVRILSAAQRSLAQGGGFVEV